MIVRLWRGCTTVVDADAYYRFVTRKVFPELERIPGHRGANVLRRELDGNVEFLVATLWDSMQAIRGFAGENADAAVIEPEARAVLAEFDDQVRHYELAYGPGFHGTL